MRIALGILQRLGGFAVVFIGVTFVIYYSVFSLPGDPIQALAGDRQLPESVVNALRERYLLDQPIWVQYGSFMAGLLRGDLGVDLTGRSIGPQLASRWPVTIALALTAWALQVVLGLLVGIVSALRHGTLLDRGLLVFTIGISCIPVFVLGLMAQLLFGVELGWLPVAGRRPAGRPPTSCRRSSSRSSAWRRCRGWSAAR